MSTDPSGSKRPVRKYTPAVGPYLRKLLYLVFGLLAVLAANSVYLASITAMGWLSGRTYEDYFYLWMFLLHLILGGVFVVPFVAFGVVHLWKARRRKNRRAVRIGYALFTTSLLILISGLLLTRILDDLKTPAVRNVVYWIHVAGPLVAGWLYWLHRLAGPRIHWRIGVPFGAVVVAAVALMLLWRSQDPRQWGIEGPASPDYFEPSLARTNNGKFIRAETLMMTDYCKKCHQDSYDGWFHSVHHFGTFNNPAYLATVRETREVALKRDGSVKAARWCAGCHDPVPFLSGAFDDPDFDDVNHPTAHAGITCTVCHAITHVNSNRGNADYTIEEPLHYPFASSTNPVLQFVNQQLIKAKPSFHKKTFLKDFHKTAEFCSTCHKVHLPFALNKYKEFLRGQNHYDSYLLSGVSGHGARSFYYPDEAKTNCSQCHMPTQESNQFAAALLDDSGKLKIHDHLFPSANTAIAWLRNKPEIVNAHQQFLEGVMRVDIFGIREGGEISGKLAAPIRPRMPQLKSGEKYLLEVVIRTMKMGHHFTQGTVDSNEIWLDVTVRSNGAVIGRSGALEPDTSVDPWAHFVNVYMLDKDGNRIDRRNAQDIFVPLYNHQIPPGAGQTVHYALEIPPSASGEITIDVKLNFRKFDKIYMDHVTRAARPGDPPIRGHERGKPYRNQLPVTTLAQDRVTLPLAETDTAADQLLFPPASDNAVASPYPQWQRWNDYGIGLLLKGKAELLQAEQAFKQVDGLYHGPLNLARVYFEEGRIDEAVQALNRASQFQDPPAPPWTLAFLRGQVNVQQLNLEDAVENFKTVLNMKTAETVRRKFDFSKDYVVRNYLGEALFSLGRRPYKKAERLTLFRDAVDSFQQTLVVDSENVEAHHNLFQLYQQLGETELAQKHRKLHERYRPDPNAPDRAVLLARQKSAAANHAAEKVVIYPLRRKGAPGFGPTSRAILKQPDDPTRTGREQFAHRSGHEH